MYEYEKYDNLIFIHLIYLRLIGMHKARQFLRQSQTETHWMHLTNNLPKEHYDYYYVYVRKMMKKMLNKEKKKKS